MAVAVAVLSPWPTSPVALANATTCLMAAIGPDLDDTTGQRLGAVASALVEQYAPDAPQVLRNEAVLRVVGWLLDAPSSNIRGQTIGPMQVDFAPSQRGALLHSGAKTLLYPFRRKTAGVAK